MAAEGSTLTAWHGLSKASAVMGWCKRKWTTSKILSMYVSLFFYSFFFISTCTCISVCRFIYLSNYREPVPIYLSIYPSVYSPIYLSIYLSTYLPIYLPTYQLISLSIHLSIYLSFFQFYRHDDHLLPHLPHHQHHRQHHHHHHHHQVNSLCSFRYQLFFPLLSLHNMYIYIFIYLILCIYMHPHLFV